MSIDNTRGLHNAKPGEIADPVHRYIRFTSIERGIIDHRVTQRLRYISQAGLVQLVYPEVRTSRFSHSLGVMHLASRFLASSLRNAASDVRSELFTAFNNILRMAAGRFGSLSQAAKILEQEPLETGGDTSGAGCSGIRLIEQALRLAALFHDLGHLPFSHDFETALEELGREQKISGGKSDSVLPTELFEQDASAGKLHERLGRRLSELLLMEIIDDIPPEKVVATKIAFDLAQQIFDSTATRNPNPEEAAIRWLHTLIDGEIDVDRADYILRDGRNYAFEFATLDLSRLSGNLVVTKENGAFILAILPHGISAVEDFMLARYRSYQYGVRHHKVAQTGAALQHCIKVIVQKPRNAAGFEQFIKDIVYLARVGAEGRIHDEFIAHFEDADERKQFLRRFAAYDDVWWTGIMRTYDIRDEWFELVCWRQAGPRTLWKWLGDFPKKEDIAKWNARLPGKRDENESADWFAEKLRLEQQDVIIIRHKFQPWEPEDEKGASEDSKLCVLMKEQELKPITQLSHLLKSLPAAWMEEIQVQAFKKSGCLLTDEDIYDRLSLVMKKEEEEEQNGSHHVS